MNRIARTLTNLTIATGMATAALSLGSVAHAETPPAPKPGPVIVLPPADPGPKGPGDIAVPTPEPTDGPDDIKAPTPKPQPPKGPKDLSNGDSDPVVDPKPEQPSDTKPAAPEAKHVAPKPTDVVTEAPEAPVVNGTATDAADATDVADAPVVESSNVAAQNDGDSSYLLWLLAGLGAAGAAGTGFIVVARRRKASEQA